MATIDAADALARLELECLTLSEEIISIDYSDVEADKTPHLNWMIIETQPHIDIINEFNQEMANSKTPIRIIRVEVHSSHRPIEEGDNISKWFRMDEDLIRRRNEENSKDLDYHFVLELDVRGWEEDGDDRNANYGDNVAIIAEQVGMDPMGWPSPVSDGIL